MVLFNLLQGRRSLIAPAFLMHTNCFALEPPPAIEPVPELIIEHSATEQFTPLAQTANGFKPKRFASHNDPIQIDKKLNLKTVVAQTLEKLPDLAWLDALEKEAATLKGRGESWTAGASQAGLRFQEATSGTLHYIDAVVQVPLWNFGQRNAEQRIATLAEHNTQVQADALQLKVAGLVRKALWEIALATLAYEQTRIEANTLEKLQAKVTRRVELGDLPRADLLLAQTELLQKYSLLTQTEAELMHARKRYLSLTQGAKMPAQYEEHLAKLTTIEQNHPALLALMSQIERKQGEIKAASMMGSGQTQLAIGINSDRGNDDPRSNHTESFNIGVNVPFGGEANTLHPHLAALNVDLNKLFAERQQLVRDLELAHHEAEHNLEVNQVEMAIAEDLKKVAEEHLKMTELSFSVGEINLIDLLKIQSRTQQAVLNAKQRTVMLQRDIAFYNQAVGILP